MNNQELLQNKDNKLNIDDIIVVELDEFPVLGDYDTIVVITVNSKIFYKIVDLSVLKKCENFSDYQIGIILDHDFIPSGTHLKLHSSTSQKKGCSYKIKRRKKTKFPFLLNDIRICRKDRRVSDSNKLKPIKLITKVIKIDSKKKFIDLAIGDFYKLTKIY